MFLPALILSRAGIHTALVLFAWGRSTLSKLSSASRCGRFAPGGLSLRRELSPAFPTAMVCRGSAAIAVVGFAGGSRGGNGDGRVPFSFLCRGIQRQLPGLGSTLWRSGVFPPGTVVLWGGRWQERRRTTLVCAVWGACGGYNSRCGRVKSWMACREAGWTLKEQVRWAFFEV